MTTTITITIITITATTATIRGRGKKLPILVLKNKRIAMLLLVRSVGLLLAGKVMFDVMPRYTLPMTSTCAFFFVCVWHLFLF